MSQAPPSTHRRVAPDRATPDQAKRYAAPALEKGLDILEHLAGASGEETQTQIAEALGRSQSELYRMLASLEDRGYVLRDADTGGYRLSLRLYELAHRTSSVEKLRRAAELPMDRLADQTGESCHLCLTHGGNALVLLERMPRQRVCLAVGEGTSLPISQTTSGRLLLSRMPAEVAARTLECDESLAGKSATTRRRVLNALDEIRELDVVVEGSGQTEGVVDIAAPVGVDHTGTAAALTMPIIEGACRAGRRAACQRALLACVAEIDKHLGIKR